MSTVKAHKRRTKTGKIVSVNAYSRNSKVSPKTPIDEPVYQKKPAGEELKNKIDAKRTLAWEAAHGYSRPRAETKEEWEKRVRSLNEEEFPTKKSSPAIPKKKSALDKIEDKIASFVERNTNKKYKR